MSKYVRKKVKRQHGIIKGILPLLERISKIEGVKKVVPAAIFPAASSTGKPRITLQRETVSGFKLLAHSSGAVQEIFLVVTKEKRLDVKQALENYIIN
ncbi:MAG: DUF2103 domain-containing protein [Methanocellales archaeon]